jgi:hypothetical protein
MQKKKGQFCGVFLVYGQVALPLKSNILDRRLELDLEVAS